MKQNFDIVCTLFEGNYHHGLAALINSLIHVGFEGKVMVGYKGDLPSWCQSKETASFGELHSNFLQFEKVQVHFVKLETSYHLTNYKPDFMKTVGQAIHDWDHIFYFDPDIVILDEWKFFRDWSEAGICLCEDINSPMHENNPERHGWRTYFAKFDHILTFKGSAYVNGGCLGVNRTNLSFLDQWIKLQEAMAKVIGGLSVSDISMKPDDPRKSFTENTLFNKTDQDALNATVELTDLPISILGKEAMGFSHGQIRMTHALDIPKPWQKNYLKRMLKGQAPAHADKTFWEFSSKPIQTLSQSALRYKRCSLKFGAFVGRFYRRS